MNQNVRIAIFSAGCESRNPGLMKMILSRYFGDDGYKKLVRDGQFEVFSRYSLKPDESKLKYWEKGYDPNERLYDRKDLSVVLREGELIENAILVDDMPYKKSLGTQGWLKIQENCAFHTYGYYFLGLFKSYFESGLCEQMSMFDFFQVNAKFSDKSVETPNKYTHKLDAIPFEMNMMLLGLQEVRKTIPEVVLCHEDCLAGIILERSNNKSKKEERTPAVQEAVVHIQQNIGRCYHSPAEIEVVLGRLLSRERKRTEPGMVVFLGWLNTEGLVHYANLLGDDDNNVVVEMYKKLQKMTMGRRALGRKKQQTR